MTRIDGAVQYIQQLPYWFTTTALLRDGTVELAVISAPARSSTFAAWRGGGALLNGNVIRPSRKAALDAALVACTQPPFVNRRAPELAEPAGQLITRLLLRTIAVRHFGPTSLQIADVASGRLDGLCQVGSDASNLVAGSLIAMEAGAVVSEFGGDTWHPNSPSFLVAAPAIHGHLIGAIGTNDAWSAHRSRLE